MRRCSRVRLALTHCLLQLDADHIGHWSTARSAWSAIESSAERAQTWLDAETDIRARLRFSAGRWFLSDDVIAEVAVGLCLQHAK